MTMKSARVSLSIVIAIVGATVSCSGDEAERGGDNTLSGSSGSSTSTSAEAATSSGAANGSSGTGSSSSGSGGGSAASCPASDALALEDLGDDTPDGTGTPESVITIENVGGTGEYPRVTAMNPGTFGQACPEDKCVKETKQVSGPLAPFNEELTVNFRGPMELYDIGVYEPGGSGWGRVSHWNRCTSENITFMNNKGGGASGQWTPCGGNSQSYASADGKEAAPGPTAFSGSLDDGDEMNILTSTPCSGEGDASDCGFYRDVGLHGWGGAGGVKLFAIRARMPRYTGPKGGSYDDEPALWILNAQIVRTAQYGCNCRGAGSPGGCGELDVAEVLNSDHRTHATSTIYSFQGAVGADGTSGAGHYFLRPVNESATFVVIFDKAGKIQMLRLAPDAFGFGASIEDARVAEWLGKSGFTMALP